MTYRKFPLIIKFSAFLYALCVVANLAHAKPTFGANCLQCHSASSGRMALAGHDTLGDFGLGSLKVYQVTAGESTQVQIDVINGGSAYALSLFKENGLGYNDPANVLPLSSPGGSWATRADNGGFNYFHTEPTSGNQIWNFGITVDASAPADVYQFEVQIGIKSGGLHAQSEKFYIEVLPAVAPNTPPVLAAIPDQYGGTGATITFTASATDTDTPAQTLSYSLSPGAPAGASIDPATGEFTWAVPANALPGVYTVEVNATDDGAPPLGDAQTASITVFFEGLLPLDGIAGNGGAIEVSVQTDAGLTYYLEYKATLGDATWTPVTSVAGDGTVKTLGDPAPAGTQGYYHVRMVQP